MFNAITKCHVFDFFCYSKNNYSCYFTDTTGKIGLYAGMAHTGDW